MKKNYITQINNINGFEEPHAQMLKEIKAAEVVITNPINFVVALRYDVKKDYCPVLIAKGGLKLAFKIMEIAMQNYIPVIESNSLTRELYATLEVGDYIP